MAVIGVELKPSAPSARRGFELVMLRLAASSVLIVIEPPWTVDGFEVPVIASILLISVWMLSVTLSWLPVAPEATKVSVVPLTVMVSPAAKPGEIEFDGAAPDSAVAPLIGAGGAAWLLMAAPIAELVGVEEIVAGGDRGCRHQRGVGELRDRGVQRGVEVRRRGGRVGCNRRSVGYRSIAKLPTGVGVAVDAVRSICSVEPSGSVN